MEKTLSQVMDQLETSCEIGYAQENRGDRVVVLEFAEQGFGFGEICLRQHIGGKLRVDSERMGRDKVKAIVCAMLDAAEFDTDAKP